MFLTTWIIIVAGLVLIIFGIIFNKTNSTEDYEYGIIMIVLGIGTMVLTSIIGFGIVGNETETFSVKEVKPIEITRSSTQVFVEVGDGWNTKTYDSKKDYDEIDSTMTFYHIQYYDYYGDKNGGKLLRDTTYAKYVNNGKHLIDLIE